MEASVAQLPLPLLRKPQAREEAQWRDIKPVRQSHGDS